MDRNTIERLESAAFYTRHVGGVEVVLRRRTNKIMLQIGGVQRVLSSLAKPASKDDDRIDDVTAFVDAQERAMRVIIHSIGGNAVNEDTDLSIIDPFADSLFMDFLGSGLSLDPTPDSSKAEGESN